MRARRHWLMAAFAGLPLAVGCGGQAVQETEQPTPSAPATSASAPAPEPAVAESPPPEAPPAAPTDPPKPETGTDELLALGSKERSPSDPDSTAGQNPPAEGGGMAGMMGSRGPAAGYPMPGGGPPGGGSSGMAGMMGSRGPAAGYPMPGGGPPGGGSSGMAGMMGSRGPAAGYPMPGGGPPGGGSGGMAAMMAGAGGPGGGGPQGPPPGYAGGSGGMAAMMAGAGGPGGGGPQGPPPGYAGGSGGMAAMMAGAGGPGGEGIPQGTPPQAGGSGGMMGMRPPGGTPAPLGGGGSNPAQMMAAMMRNRPGAADTMPGMPGLPGAGRGVPDGVPGMAGMMAGPGSGGNADQAPDYSQPDAAVRTFLDAAKNKNLTVLAEATALRAAYEARTERQRKFFEALKNENAPQEDLDELSRSVDGMQILGMSQPKSTNTRAFTIGRQEDGKLITRTVYVRREKDGWKVQDIGPARSQNVGIRPLRGAGQGAGSSGR